MKIKYMFLKTPLQSIQLEAIETCEVTQDELDEMLTGWEVILTKSDFFKFSVKNVAYAIPGSVLKNSIVEIHLEEEK